MYSLMINDVNVIMIEINCVGFINGMGVMIRWGIGIRDVVVEKIEVINVMTRFGFDLIGKYCCYYPTTYSRTSS